MAHIDAAMLRELVAGPGTDTRPWSAYAVVMPDSEGARSVRFDDPDGPKVTVKFMPSGLIADVGVTMQTGGDGEGEWHPFVAGELVVVEFPGGDELVSPVITGRKPNEHDRFPLMVAGNDVTQNNFAFKRTRAPYIFEAGSSYLLWSAATESFLALTEAGAFTVANADKALLQLGADVLGFRNGDADCLVEVHVADKRTHVEAGNSKLQLVADGDSMLLTTGSLAISTAGAQPIGHGVTVEQVWAILVALLKWLVPAITATGAVPGGGSLVGPAITTALTSGLSTTVPIATAVAAAAASSPDTIPGLQIAVRAALAAAPSAGKVGAGIPGLTLG